MYGISIKGARGQENQQKVRGEKRKCVERAKAARELKVGGERAGSAVGRLRKRKSPSTLRS